MRLAACRIFCTAGINRPMRMPMMAITTNNSTKVNPARWPTRRHWERFMDEYLKVLGPRLNLEAQHPVQRRESAQLGANNLLSLAIPPATKGVIEVNGSSQQFWRQRPRVRKDKLCIYFRICNAPGRPCQGIFKKICPCHSDFAPTFRSGPAYAVPWPLTQSESGREFRREFESRSSGYMI